MYSDKSRKLIFSLIEDYSKSVYGSTSQYYRTQSELNLKRIYSKIVLLEADRGIASPFNNFRYNLSRMIEKEFKVPINTHTNVVDEIEEYIIREVQKIYRTLDKGFSLRNALFTQDMANNFIDWLIGYFIENEIEMKQEIKDMLDISQKEKMTYACLMNGVCCISGKPTKTLHHVKSVAFTGGYKKDKGVGQKIISVTPYWHGYIHEKGMFYNDIVREFDVYPITVTENMVKKLQEKYGKNYFMAFEEE